MNSKALLETLIAFDTVSQKSNLAFIDYVATYLRAMGVTPVLFFDGHGKKANLYATIGPHDKAGIALSGHSDVVPVEGQEWLSDPFQLTEREGKLYGRGTADMKAFLAVILARLPGFLARNPVLPLHLIVTYDEEVGCLGAERLMPHLQNMTVRPLAAIVGEPTEMIPVTAHKGKISLRCRVKGHSCHSSLTPQGVNAIEYAAEVICQIRKLAERAKLGPQDHRFDVPFTSISCGVVQGGTALNIVPRDCWFDFEIRCLPHDHPDVYLDPLRQFVREELLPKMKTVSETCAIEFTPITGTPGLDMAEDAPLTEWVKSLSGANATRQVSFGSEAGLFQAAGIPVVLCGPGSITEAHKPNEFLSLDQLRLCERFVDRLMEQLCNPAGSGFRL